MNIGDVVINKNNGAIGIVIRLYKNGKVSVLESVVPLHICTYINKESLNICVEENRVPIVDERESNWWIVYEKEEDIIMSTTDYAEAVECYNKYKNSVRDWVEIFTGEEDVVLAKVDKRFYSAPTGRYNEGTEIWDFVEKEYGKGENI